MQRQSGTERVQPQPANYQRSIQSAPVRQGVTQKPSVPRGPTRTASEVSCLMQPDLLGATRRFVHGHLASNPRPTDNVTKSDRFPAVASCRGVNWPEAEGE
jgi:hypothetical protein